MKVLGICGSLRSKSFNRYALEAFGNLLEASDSFELAELHDIPLYNQDVDSKPASVTKLIEQIRNADVVVFGTPEYNYSIPGGLKNAIDWVSRSKPQPLAGKVTGIMGASPGKIGTARAQYHLRQVGVFLDMRIINKPEVMIGECMQKFNDSGELIDQATTEHLKTFIGALREAAS